MNNLNNDTEVLDQHWHKDVDKFNLSNIPQHLQPDFLSSHWSQDIIKFMKQDLKAQFPEATISVLTDGTIKLRKAPYEQNSQIYEALMNYLKEYASTAGFSRYDVSDTNYVQKEITPDMAAFIDNWSEKQAYDAKQAEIALHKKYQEDNLMAQFYSVKHALRDKSDSININRIMNDVSIKDTTAEPYYARNMLNTYFSKIPTLDEVKKILQERLHDPTDMSFDPVETVQIQREIHFHSQELFDYYKNHLLMASMPEQFYNGVGGSFTDAFDTQEEYARLTPSEREQIEWTSIGCGIFLNDEFQFVVDSEGYDYGRYTIIPSDETFLCKTKDGFDIATATNGKDVDLSDVNVPIREVPVSKDANSSLTADVNEFTVHAFYPDKLSWSHTERAVAAYELFDESGKLVSFGAIDSRELPKNDIDNVLQAAVRHSADIVGKSPDIKKHDEQQTVSAETSIDQPAARRRHKTF